MAITPDLSGHKLGDYVLLKKLTTGGMAHIYLGEDSKLGRRAAIKVLTPEIAGTDPTLRERFEREARAVARLEHDHIVPIYQYGEADELYFIAMRYIEGHDLNGLMKAYKEREELMPIARALYILEQIARALDHAHERDIIHRDVKPSNILLDSNDRAFLSDFGLVLWQNVDQTLGTAFGTPRYISPEQATDSMSVVPQSDIYSLAVIVYEVLTNQSLFSGNTPMEVALAHVTEQPIPPRTINPDIPANAQVEIMKALSKAPQRRHKSATLFVERLKKAYQLSDTHQTDSVPVVSAAQTPLPSNTISFSEQEMNDHLSQDSSPSILHGWGQDSGSQATNNLAEEPASSVELTHNTWLMAASGVGVLLILVGLLVFTVLNSGLVVPLADNSNPTAQAETAATEVINLRLFYNDDFFALVNQNADVALNIDGIAIDGNTTPFGDVLDANECVFLKFGDTRDTDVPDEWGCDASQATVNGNVFWRADDTDEQNFTVRRGTTALGSCPTVGRAVERVTTLTCDFEWDDFQLLDDA